MNDAPPIQPETPASPPVPRSSRKLLLGLIALAAAGAVALGVATLVLLPRLRNYATTRLGLPTGPSGPRDFSTSNSVSMVLGEQETGCGVLHIATERDGLTSITTVDGLNCRGFNLLPHSDGRDWLTAFYYFALDSSFKQTNSKSVRIEVEYYSERRGTVALQYDAQAASRSTRSIYTRAGPAMSLDGAKVWETATFHIRDGAFLNGQNGGADFRLEVSPPELWVRRVTVTREPRED